MRPFYGLAHAELRACVITKNLCWRLSPAPDGLDYIEAATICACVQVILPHRNWLMRHPMTQADTADHASTQEVLFY